MIKLYGKPIKVNKASQDKRTQDVGANIFVGNLDLEVDEKLLYETFSNFGMVISTKITRDAEDGASKGHGFVSYDNFTSADLAIAQMNGQYFSGKQIRCEYAVKKDSKGEKQKAIKPQPFVPALPLAKGGINPMVLPPKPALVKMPEIRLPQLPFPPPPQ
jgi:splicing factor 3B subunit 4